MYSCSWSLLNTDGNITWGPDALLTPLGTQQALTMGTAWKNQSAQGAPLPESFYSSPLSRSSDTLALTWAGRVPAPGKPVGALQVRGKEAVPVFVEVCRYSGVSAQELC